jgi:hypothetical protein
MNTEKKTIELLYEETYLLEPVSKDQANLSFRPKGGILHNPWKDFSSLRSSK